MIARCMMTLPGAAPAAIFTAMFVVTEADAAAIRATYEQEGELSAAIELRRRFPGIIDNAKARECARSIAGWRRLGSHGDAATPPQEAAVAVAARNDDLRRKRASGAPWLRLNPQ